jgi:hypothetical protein
MQEHQLRVVDELAELHAKVERLQCFLNEASPTNISGEEYSLLRQQLSTMRDYESILKQRIAAF